MRTESASFTGRESRSLYVKQRFRTYLKESVLDVGCYKAPLRRLLDDVEYKGVDREGDPDFRVDLEMSGRLPFGPHKFHCVLCIDVLEHLNNLHDVFAELVRVSSRYVIVSLPNCWADARRAIEKGRGNIGHYGLPLHGNGDRHKWFFNTSQAETFLQQQAKAYNLDVKELFVTLKDRHPLIKLLRRTQHSRLSYLNRYAQTVWAVLEKPTLASVEPLQLSDLVQEDSLDWAV